MPADVLKLVESVLAQKTALANKERELINDLNRVLPGIGYRVVPLALRGPKPQNGRRRAGLVRTVGKPLSCPQCARTFAHPLHLGRHMSATHGAKRAARGRGKVKARKKAS